MKKSLSIILAAIITMAAITISYGNADRLGAVSDYSDLKSVNWAYPSVMTMTEKGIIKGYPDGTFRPSNTVTYGEFIKMALVASTSEDVGNAPTTNPNTGEKQSWAANYYNKALELKYFKSTSIKPIQMNLDIPRAEMALIVSSILGDVTINEYDKLESQLKDVDASVRNDYDIIKAYATGIITGYEDGSFKPEGTLTRAEAATVIYRLMDSSKRVQPENKEGSTTLKEQENIQDDRANHITIGFTGSDKTLEKTYIPAKLGDYGIAKIQIMPDTGYVAIYSTVKYDSIFLIIDNIMIDGFLNAKTDNHYWEIDGYYVYFAEPLTDNIDVKGKVPVLWFLDDNLHKFEDVKL